MVHYKQRQFTLSNPLRNTQYTTKPGNLATGGMQIKITTHIFGDIEPRVHREIPPSDIDTNRGEHGMKHVPQKRRGSKPRRRPMGKGSIE